MATTIDIHQKVLEILRGGHPLGTWFILGNYDWALSKTPWGIILYDNPVDSNKQGVDPEVATIPLDSQLGCAILAAWDEVKA